MTIYLRPLAWALIATLMSSRFGVDANEYVLPVHG